MQPLQQQVVQCLVLSRPESISTAGYCADTVIQAVRYPQPMLYSPARGALVTYEPPRKTGLEDLQWLDDISKPKQTTAKSLKARPKCQQHKQQPEQQQQRAAPQPTACELESLNHSHLRGLPPEALAAVERSTTNTQQAAAEAAHNAACLLERQLVSYPQVFSWGGRVKGKHSSFCRMHTAAQPSNSNSGVATAAPTSAAAAGCGGNSKAAYPSPSPATSDAEGPTPTMNLNLGVHTDGAAGRMCAAAGGYRTSKFTADADVAAAAAQLGARADKLLKVLDSRQERKAKQQQRPGQRSSSLHSQQQPSRRIGALRPAVPGLDGGSSGAEEPLCAAVDYLTL